MNYQPLEWDSEFFDLKVARIEDPDLETNELSKLLSKLRTEQFQLVYWPATRECETSIAEQFSGTLVDLKTTLCVNLQSLDATSATPADKIIPYQAHMDITQLRKLSIQAGEYSRFAVDSHFPREKFIALYEHWIDQCVDKIAASEVLVLPEDDKIAGMVTVGEKNGRGDIGLIAVDAQYRERGFGEALVRAAQNWSTEQGQKIGQVVTQGENTPAMNLYKRNGYAVESLTYYYHFWL
ncbi:MAG: GNAT family N-acetyltransferase [Verrucomicrobiota bacterium]